MSKSPKFVTTAADAARVLGLSRRQFDRLVRAGVLTAHAPRQFDLATVVQAYTQYVEQGREGASTIAEAKLRSERERGRKLAIENELKVGRLVFADQVGEVLSELSANLVQVLEAVPGRHADEMAGLDRPEARARLLTITRAIRASFADGIVAVADRLAKA